MKKNLTYISYCIMTIFMFVISFRLTSTKTAFSDNGTENQSPAERT